MSGFIGDLRNWALSGGAGEGEEEGATAAAAPQEQTTGAAATQEELTADQVRALRLARISQAPAVAAAAPAAAASTAKAAAVAESEPTPMETSPTPSPTVPKKSVAEAPSTSTVEPMQVDETKHASPKKKKAKSELAASSTLSTPHTPQDVAARKLQRKKELLLKRVLQLSLVGTSTDAPVQVDIDSTVISPQTVAEILATRLTLATPATATQPLLNYLAESYQRAAEEQKGKQVVAELTELLQEIQKQLVSYAASCVLEPDLFPGAATAPQQIAKLLLPSFGSSSSSSALVITTGVAGLQSSFYYQLCEELIQQDVAAMDQLVWQCVDCFTTKLQKCESVLEGDSESSPSVLVTALQAVCLHKRAAEAMTRHAQFLLPAAGTPVANELIRPPPPAGGLLSMLSAASEFRPYKKRSGPALEKQTVLGMALSKGTPKANASFSPTSILRQTLDAVERVSDSQRRQLSVHQEACHRWLLSLIKGGPAARARVMHWFVDALSVNQGASAMRVDASKVSSQTLLLNTSVALLKLCAPFVDDPTKQHLIHPGFVSSPEAHGGVFATTGDHAVARLGETSNTSSDMAVEYHPKNTFIPQCFFLCARSFHYGICPVLHYHNTLLRHISHAHYEITSQGRDLHSDPHFGILVSRQRSNEVALFQESMVTETLRFCNCMAKVLSDMDEATLQTMPEDFCSDVCDIMMNVAKLKGKLMRGIDFRSVFQLLVKLLSPKYASMVRNYNLRALLGDVLYELFLPTSQDDRREVPASVFCDPLAGGQTYLLSDPAAQETLAPSLLLLYGEVEHTGSYEKMSHRAKIQSLIKYLWESSQHRPAFRRITQNKDSFIKFANGIINETNTLIATVMQKLPEIREAQEKMHSPDWGRLSEDEQGQISSRLEDNEQEVRHALPLCNKTLQMFGYLNTDQDIRNLFLLEELCPRLVTMLLHVLTKLVGSKGLELKVENPEKYEFRPKEMLRDLCAIFALFAAYETFQVECAKSGCDPDLLRKAVKTCAKLRLLTGESMEAFEALPSVVESALRGVAQDEALLADAPEEFLDEILSSFMKDPVVLPSGHYVDRSTITQHLLNDPIDPFNREPLSLEDIKPATELKERMQAWLAEKRAAKSAEME